MNNTLTYFSETMIFFLDTCHPICVLECVDPCLFQRYLQVEFELRSTISHFQPLLITPDTHQQLTRKYCPQNLKPTRQTEGIRIWLKPRIPYLRSFLEMYVRRRIKLVGKWARFTKRKKTEDAESHDCYVIAP